MAFTTNQQIVAEYYIASLGRAPEKAGLDYWVGRLESTGSDALTADQIRDQFLDRNIPEVAARFPADASVTDTVNSIYLNVFGRDADSDGLAYWVGRLTGVNESGQAQLSENELISAMLTEAKNNTVDAATLTESLTAAETVYEAADAGSDAASEAAAAKNDANALKLTTGADIIQGTDADDTITAFIGTNSVNGNNQDTLSSIDIIDGGDGYDTLTIQQSSTANPSGPTIANVEAITLTQFGNQNFNMSNVTGVESFTNKGSINPLNILAVSSIMDLTVQNVNNNATNLTYNASAVTGLTDTQKLTLDNASNNAEINFKAAAIETLAITTSGNASRIDLDDLGVSLKTITVDGDQNLRIDNLDLASGTAEVLTSFDASANTGNIRVDLATNVTATKMDVKTSIGDDMVIFANMTKDDSFDMGAGNDTLVLSAFGGETKSTTMTGVENIVFSAQAANATLNAAGATELESITITSTGAANTNTITKAVATAKTINFDTMDGTTNAATYENVTFGLATTTGTSDELTLNFQNTNATGAHVNIDDDTQMTVATITANGIETINLNTADMGANNNATLNDSGLVITTLATDKIQTLNITSDSLVTITSGLDSDVNDINATTATAGVVLNLTNGADNSETTHASSTLNIDTGAGADTLASVKADVATTVINTGAGKDSIALKAGDFGSGDTTNVDTITIDAGEGDDTVDVSLSTTLVAEGTISVTLGDGVDTIKIDGAQANQTGITITDFVVGSGGDKIDLAASTAAQYANLTTVANMASGELVNGMNIYTLNDAASLSTTDMATAFAAGTALVDANTAGDIGYIIASDGTDAGLYEFTDAAGTTAIAAGELVLLATLTGVSDASKLTADNFTDFLA